jgi:hypothetical protein
LDHELPAATSCNAEIDVSDVHQPLELSSTDCSSPYDFNTMTPNEIYDEFHKGKANNMDFCARFVFSKLVTDQKLGKNTIVKHVSVA